LKTCQPIDPALLSVDALAARDFRQAEHQLAGKTLLLTSTRLATPFCWQLHRPYIVLPEYLLGFGEQELRFVIRHELAHLGNGHPLQLFLQRVVEILFWFHPMVWWASQQSNFAREFACDDAAIDSPTEIGAYLRSLLTIVECGAAESQNVRGPLAFGAGENLISKRARRLVQIARNGAPQNRRHVPEFALSLSLILTAAVTAFIWLPADVLASPRSRWSPWPAWSSAVLHDFGVTARDFDVYYGPFEPHELQERGQAIDPAGKSSQLDHQ
jgi:beta-lactamase regulating signal transducer with metallopeptidase domain